MHKLWIFDLDHTLIDSREAILESQIFGLARATGEDRSELEEELKESNLETALNIRKINSDYFFRVCYHAFDPAEAAKNNKMRAYPDTLNVLPKLKGEKAVISNSSQQAAEEKLKVLGLDNEIDHVLAEYEAAKAKPSPAMAKKLAERLKVKPARIINIGDNERDVEFGYALAEVFQPNEIVNILIDREGTYDGGIDYDAKVKSLEEIRKYG